MHLKHLAKIILLNCWCLDIIGCQGLVTKQLCVIDLALTVVFCGHQEDPCCYVACPIKIIEFFVID
jgi:hypothetical protein